jgi:hypothetical protein
MKACVADEFFFRADASSMLKARSCQVKRAAALGVAARGGVELERHLMDVEAETMTLDEPAYERH